MPVETIPLSVVGGFDSARARSETRGDYPNSRNHVLAPGGRGIKPRPGYVKAGAFCLHDGYRLNEHRIVISDGGDYAREPGSTVFNIVDGWTGDVKAMQKFSGGVPFPSDSDNNPNPPHEFMTDKKLHDPFSGFASGGNWSTSGTQNITRTAATTAPVLRKTTDSTNGPIYGGLSIADSSVSTGNLCYRDLPGFIPGGHNAVQLWLYFDGDERQIPAGTFSFVFASSTALGGTTKELVIPINLPPNRWICATMDWDNDGATFVYASFGLKLNAALSSTLFQSNAVVLRLESLYSGRVFNLNRVSNNDTFHMNELPGPVKGIIFGNEFNADLMYDGKDLMPAGIPAPHFKPGLSLKQDVDTAATVLSDGTDSASWIEPSGAAGPYFAVSSTTPTAATTIDAGTAAWSVGSGQGAFVSLANTNTNPISPSGGNYAEFTFTNQPVVGTAAYRDLGGAVTLQDILEFSLYLDFFASGTGAYNEVIYRGDTLTLKLWSGAVSGGAPSGSLVAEVNLWLGGYSATGTGVPVPSDAQLATGIIWRASQPQLLRRWFVASFRGLTGGTIRSISIEFKHALESTAIYDGSSQWKIRLDNIRTYTNDRAPDGQHLDLIFTRNPSGVTATATPDCPITTDAEKLFVYKNSSSSIGANKAIQFWLRLDSGTGTPPPISGIPAELFKLEFYTVAGDGLAAGVAPAGTRNQPSESYGVFPAKRNTTTDGVIDPNSYAPYSIPWDQWTRVTIKMLPAGFSFAAFGLRLLKKIPESCYGYDGNSNICRIKIDDIRIVDSGAASTDIATDGLRAGFTFYDEERQRESALSPFSDPLNLPANAAGRLEISGFREGLPINSENRNPDPLRIGKIGVYVHFPLWGLTADGIPRFNRLGYFPIPGGGAGAQYLDFTNTEDLTKVGDTAPLASFTNHYPPACKTAIAHKSRIARAGQARYSVGQVACTASSPVITAVSAGGTATPAFDNWMRFLKMRLLLAGAESLQFTIFHVYDTGSAAAVLASTTFDQVNNEWRLDTVPVTSTGADYLIEGEDNALFWTSEDQGRIKPWAAAITNRDDLPGSDRIEGLHLVGEVLLVCGRDSLYAYRQSSTVDDVAASGPAYSNPTQLGAKPGILAHRSFARDAGGTSHWLGRGGVIYGGSLAGGFIADPLSNPLRKLFAEGTTIHKESLQYAHGAYDDRRKRYYLFTPGVDE